MKQVRINFPLVYNILLRFDAYIYDKKALELMFIFQQAFECIKDSILQSFKLATEQYIETSNIKLNDSEIANLEIL